MKWVTLQAELDIVAAGSGIVVATFNEHLVLEHITCIACSVGVRCFYIAGDAEEKARCSVMSRVLAIVLVE